MQQDPFRVSGLNQPPDRGNVLSPVDGTCPQRVRLGRARIPQNGGRKPERKPHGFVSRQSVAALHTDGHTPVRGRVPMAKAAHHEAPHQTESQNGQQFRGMIQPEAVIETYGKFLKQMEAFNRQWLGSMRQTAEAGWELASQMAGCGTGDGPRLS